MSGLFLDSIVPYVLFSVGVVWSVCKVQELGYDIIPGIRPPAPKPLGDLHK